MMAFLWASLMLGVVTFETGLEILFKELCRLLLCILMEHVNSQAF